MTNEQKDIILDALAYYEQRTRNSSDLTGRQINEAVKIRNRLDKIKECIQAVEYQAGKELIITID